MSNADTEPICPHCNAPLEQMELPAEGGWEGQMQWVCFNDGCPYFREGWEWIWERYRARASYRYRILDAGGAATSPLPVWSDTAMRERILPRERH